MSKADPYSKEYPPFYFIGWKSCCPLITCPIPSHACIFKKGVLQFLVPKKVAGGDVMISEEAKKIASQCRHYAMCKIDFLGTGLCPSGMTKHYVSYYPQGRMDIYHALVNNLIPVTEELIVIARTCTLCGICDKQCHFITGLRPLKVMRALKDYVERYLQQNREIKKAERDPVLDGLKEIVGEEWANNDPAILVTYANDPFPLTDLQMPKYIVLPRTSEEILKIVKLSKELGIPYAVRGNGGSVYGAVFTDGIVLDTNRMKGIAIDWDNWTVTIEAGVTSFDLQRESWS
jgi:hypothetical protein